MNLFVVSSLFSRSVLKKKLYKVSLPGYSSMETQSCESTGQETVRSLVERIFKESGNTRLKPPFENMLFYNANNECLNVGLPVGVLSIEETYICSFKNDLKFHPSDLCRQYAVKDFSMDWTLGYFLVSFSEGEIASDVSEFSKIISTNMKVDFFNDETIFEALVRDKRFKEEKLRKCKVVNSDQVEISLSAEAGHIQGQCIEIFSLEEEDTALPEDVPPRPHPDRSVTTVGITQSNIKQESTSVTCSSTPSSPTPVDSSTPSTGTSVKTGEKSGPLVEITGFRIDRKHKELTAKNEKEPFKPHETFEPFALKEGCRTYIYDLEELTEIAKSVGAIFVLDNNKPFLCGTCFRIGTVYIITNNHVIEDIEKLNVEKNDVFVDFNFNGADDWQLERRYIDFLLVRSVKLDYAILKMEEPEDVLPPCIFSHGVSIMNPDNSDWRKLDKRPVRLIGHPNGEPKQVDLRCTVDASQQDSAEFYFDAIGNGVPDEEANEECLKLKDENRGRYQSSDFFFGSSGSPGIVRHHGRKWLVFLHCGGSKNRWNEFFIEQGVLLTEIYKDTDERIKDAQQNPSVAYNPLQDVELQDIFASVDSEPKREIFNFKV